MDVDDPDMTLDIFTTWRVDALKPFLEKRGLSIQGTKAELTALCYAADKMRVPVKVSFTEAILSNSKVYSEMLVIDGSPIPDPFKVCENWSGEINGIVRWPPVYLSDITNFLMQNVPDPDSFLNEYKAGKAYEYFSSNWLKEVFYHPMSVESPLCMLRSQCSPSQRVGDTDHSVWAIVHKESGTIKRAYCSCADGLGQTCNHVAGLLFRVEHANNKGLTVTSCTSLPCTWNIPAEKIRYGSQMVCDMNVVKSRHGKSEKKRSQTSTQKKMFQPLTKPIDDPLKSLAKAFSLISPNACLFKGFKVPDTDQCPDLEISTLTEPQNTASIPLEKISIIQQARSFSEKSTSATEFFDKIEHLSNEQIGMVEKNTKKQSESVMWHNVRKGRITSSRFHSVFTKVNTIMNARQNHQADPDTKSLVDSILGRKFVNPNIRALKHGRELEPLAKQNFVKAMRPRHKAYLAEDSGVYIHRDHQYLAASPDMLVSCACCGHGTVEIKCPLISSCSKCSPLLCHCQGNLPYFDYFDGKQHLKKNHA